MNTMGASQPRLRLAFRELPSPLSSLTTASPQGTCSQHRLYALSPVLTVRALTPPAPLSYEVPNDWALKPSGLGGQRRVPTALPQLGDKRNAVSSASIYRLQRASWQGDDVLGQSSVDATIRALPQRVPRAGLHSDVVDARDNTATTGTGVAIYWLDGAQVADDYGDFYDGELGLVGSP